MKLFPMLVAGTLLLPVAAQADKPFARKAGEWEITIIEKDGKTESPEKFCYLAASVDDITKRMGDCTKRDIRTTGDTTTIDAICTKGSQQATLHVTITASSDSAYHSDLHVTYSPSIGGRTDVDIVTDAKWLGPCAPGEKPVDYTAGQADRAPIAARRANPAVRSHHRLKPSSTPHADPHVAAISR